MPLLTERESAGSRLGRARRIEIATHRLLNEKNAGGSQGTRPSAGERGHPQASAG